MSAYYIRFLYTRRLGDLKNNGGAFSIPMGPSYSSRGLYGYYLRRDQQPKRKEPTRIGPGRTSTVR